MPHTTEWGPRCTVRAGEIVSDRLRKAICEELTAHPWLALEPTFSGHRYLLRDISTWRSATCRLIEVPSLIRALDTLCPREQATQQLTTSQ